MRAIEVENDVVYSGLKRLDNEAMEFARKYWPTFQWRISRRCGAVICHVLRVLDLVTISYAGAHVGNINDLLTESKSPLIARFGACIWEHTLAGSRVPDGQAITFAPRTLQCLDGFLDGAQVWVFHELNSIFNLDERLYLSAQAEIFKDIWGPMWRILGAHGSVLRYELEHGSIIIVDSNSSVLRTGIIPNDDEQLCHWVNTRDAKFVGKPNNHSHVEKQWLLIGASQNLVLHYNDSCLCSPSEVTRRFRQINWLHAPDTLERARHVEAEAFGFNVTGGMGPTIGYQMTTKTTTGRTWKESLVKRWTIEKTGRNPHTLYMRRGIEISFCTHHSRRVRVIDLLCTDTMKNLVRAMSPIEDREVGELVLEAFFENPINLISLYYDPEAKKSVTELIGCCLQALSETGTKSKFDAPLCALWVNDNIEWLVEFPRKYFKWSGLVQDCRDNCALVVLDSRCLTSERGRGCQWTTRSGHNRIRYPMPPFLETRLVINDLKSLPPGIIRRRVRGPGAKWRWVVRDLRKGSFRMGIHGCLEVVKPVSKTMLLMQWFPEPPLVESMRSLTSRILQKDPLKYHFELLDEDADEKYVPIVVFVASR
jgi:hypothetical protein